MTAHAARLGGQLLSGRLARSVGEVVLEPLDDDVLAALARDAVAVEEFLSPSARP